MLFTYAFYVCILHFTGYQNLLSSAHWQDKTHWAKIKTWYFIWTHRPYFFSVRVAQKDYGVCLHRGIQNPTGHDHWQAALGDPACLGDWTVHHQEVTFSQNHSVNPWDSIWNPAATLEYTDCTLITTSLVSQNSEELLEIYVDTLLESCICGFYPYLWVVTFEIFTHIWEICKR